MAIPIKSINRLETGLKDNRCFYVCYKDPSVEEHKIGIETFEQAVYDEIKRRIQYIKTGKC
jgi:hypothetical protein